MHPKKNLPADTILRLVPGGIPGIGPVNLFPSKHLQRMTLIPIQTINQIYNSYAILPRIISLICFNSNICGGIVPLKSLKSVYMKGMKYISKHQKKDCQTLEQKHLKCNLQKFSSTRLEAAPISEGICPVNWFSFHSPPSFLPVSICAKKEKNKEVNADKRDNQQ